MLIENFELAQICPLPLMRSNWLLSFGFCISDLYITVVITYLSVSQIEMSKLSVDIRKHLQLNNILQQRIYILIASVWRSIIENIECNLRIRLHWVNKVVYNIMMNSFMSVLSWLLFSYMLSKLIYKEVGFVIFILQSPRVYICLAGSYFGSSTNIDFNIFGKLNYRNANTWNKIFIHYFFHFVWNNDIIIIFSINLSINYQNLPIQ
jgi:hypothetical protein